MTEPVFFYERDAEGAGRPGLVDLTDVEVPAGTRAYLCGPLPFMRAVRAQLIEKGVAPADIHYEVRPGPLARQGGLTPARSPGTVAATQVQPRSTATVATAAAVQGP